MKTPISEQELLKAGFKKVSFLGHYEYHISIGNNNSIEAMFIDEENKFGVRIAVDGAGPLNYLYMHIDSIEQIGQVYQYLTGKKL